MPPPQQIAAINNNPFEYWITHDDPKYNQMMQDVQACLDEPGAADVAVSTVLANLVGQLVETPSARLLKHIIRCFLRRGHGESRQTCMYLCFSDASMTGLILAVRL